MVRVQYKGALGASLDGEGIILRIDGGMKCTKECGIGMHHVISWWGRLFDLFHGGNNRIHEGNDSGSQRLISFGLEADVSSTSALPLTDQRLHK